ncbi:MULTISPECIES: aminoglycoside N(3)-acetyltransferase [Bacillus]|uniref:aminoglycoside N(3)-acetyltransferase n=1 Tax=Bacillus TaxID=1386 RepID=UPI000BB67F87|nr:MULTISPECIES: AAC(3) family N-acetyltransferase [Bacillus]
MSEGNVIKEKNLLVTKSTLIQEFRNLGVKEGMTLIVHSSLSLIGWVCGGAPTVIMALQEVLTEEGTLVMPTHTGNNSDPADWGNPPVPKEWWQPIRDEMPGFMPEVTPTFFMGAIPESFRKFPNVLRSHHPTVSFAAWGKYANYITEKHPLTKELGYESPLGKIYRLDGHVLLLGVGYDSNTSMHLAEEGIENYPTKQSGSAIIKDGKRKWVTYTSLAYQEELFEAIGEEFEASCHEDIINGNIGKAPSKLMRQIPLVDFTQQYLLNNKGDL